MDLAEMMKTIMTKEAGTAAAANSSVASSVAVNNPAILAGASSASSGTGSVSSSQPSNAGTPFGTTYITEKLYTVLQMYLQHKGWNSVELLQCFAEMKEAAMIPNAAAYLQYVSPTNLKCGPQRPVVDVVLTTLFLLQNDGIKGNIGHTSTACSQRKW